MASYEEHQVIRAHRAGSPVRLGALYGQTNDSLEQLRLERRGRSQDSRPPRSRSPAYDDEPGAIKHRRQRSRTPLNYPTSTVAAHDGHENFDHTSPSPIHLRKDSRLAPGVQAHGTSHGHRRRHSDFNQQPPSPRDRHGHRRVQGSVDYRPPNPRHIPGERRVSFSQDRPSDIGRKRGESRRRSTSPRRSEDDDTDDECYSSADEKLRREKVKREKLLIAGLACITTAAAANNIYQSTVAYEARRKLVREGDMSEDESKRLKNKHRMRDLFALSVAAVGINNARNGWKRYETYGR